MANRSFKPMEGTIDMRVVLISGSFAPNGASAIDNTQNTGKGWTVARTGVGQYTITLSDSYPQLLAATVTLALSAVGKNAVQLGAIDVVTAKTIVINNVDSSLGTAAEIAANAANRVHFMLTLRNSTVS